MRHESPTHRSWVMGRVRSRNTAPELRVRRHMHRAGYRYRLHVSKLPGKPDIVMARHRTAVFVNGCFWHRHPDCRYASTPRTNADYWVKKFERNVARDNNSYAALRQDGWAVLVVWECQTRNSLALANLLADILPPRH